MITFGSVCSGIESASVAWEPLGFKPLWFAEIEKFPSTVLSHHWPRIANLGDMVYLPGMMRAGLMPAPLILVGGTPCQSFSIAGLRKGLEDERGQLTMKMVELTDAIDEVRGEGDECIMVWENVPGVLSDEDNAFGNFIGALAGADHAAEPDPSDKKRWRVKNGKRIPKWTTAGYLTGPKRTVAWRVLDAQYFGVAQRRRRVFVIASARDGFDPRKVLFESEGVRRDTPPSRETSERVAGGVGTGAFSAGNSQSARSVAHTEEATPPLRAGESGTNQMPTIYRYQNETTAMLRSSSGTTDERSVPAYVLASGSRNAEITQGMSPTLTTTHDGPPMLCADTAPAVTTGAPFSKTGNSRVETEALVAFSSKDYGGDAMPECAPTLRAGGHDLSYANSGTPPGIARGQQVRRLTPIECERLQGFPDAHTLIPWRGKPAEDCPDGPRYKALGNSKAVPVVQWIGWRLLAEMFRGA